jgi:queuine tRNA-ribosyltransferase
MTFELQHTDTATSARAGRITTDHGVIETPIFMPVGTLGSVKGVHFDELRNDIKAQIILGNTYHLYLRPGTEVLKAAGGLHKFNGWERPILTDSGGYQVFSLSDNRKLSEEGAMFRSHIDGSKHFFTPENVMDIQRIIGADIIMAFDECAPGTADHAYAKKAMDLTHRWLKRALTVLMPPNRYTATAKPFSPLYKVRAIKIYDCNRPNILHRWSAKAMPLAAWPLGNRPK